MAQLFIHTTNGTFQSRDDGGEYDLPAVALALGVRSAVDIAAEEVVRGERSAAVEICIEEKNGTQVLRAVVAISVSHLKIAPLPG